MKIEIEVKIKDFRVPNFVVREGTEGEENESAGSIPLSDLSPNDLETLCDTFRRDVFKKAGKSRPPQPARGL